MALSFFGVEVEGEATKGGGERREGGGGGGEL